MSMPSRPSLDARRDVAGMRHRPRELERRWRQRGNGTNVARSLVRLAIDNRADNRRELVGLLSTSCPRFTQQHTGSDEALRRKISFLKKTTSPVNNSMLS